jgi:hypothetical protein
MPTIDEIAQAGGQPHLAWARLEGLRDHCFLCDADLVDGERTDEHVLPKWLQRRFELHSGSTLRLLNETSLRYPDARIPCCRTCNNEWLSRAEKRVMAAFEAGYDAVVDLDPDLLFAWLAKIFYGVLYREALLRRDRASGDEQAIVSPEGLAEMAMFRMLLQWFRDGARWSTPPGSVWVYRSQTADDIGHNFDYADNVSLECIGMRIGSTAVVAALRDWGLMREQRPHRLTIVEDLELHPIQFREVYATVVDYEWRRQFDSCYTALFSDEPTPMVLLQPCFHRMTDPIYAPHSDEVWAEYLSAVTGVPLELLRAGESVGTYLHDAEGEPRFLPFRGGMAVATVGETEYAFDENPSIGMFRRWGDNDAQHNASEAPADLGPESSPSD